MDQWTATIEHSTGHWMTVLKTSSWLVTTIESYCKQVVKLRTKATVRTFYLMTEISGQLGPCNSCVVTHNQNLEHTGFPCSWHSQMPDISCVTLAVAWRRHTCLLSGIQTDSEFLHPEGEQIPVRAAVGSRLLVLPLRRLRMQEWFPEWQHYHHLLLFLHKKLWQCGYSLHWYISKNILIAFRTFLVCIAMHAIRCSVVATIPVCVSVGHTDSPIELDELMTIPFGVWICGAHKILHWVRAWNHLKRGNCCQTASAWLLLVGTLL